MIREAIFEDIGAIANIVSTVWKSSYKGIIDDEYLEERTVEKIAVNLINSFDNEKYFVFEENNVIKGLISIKIIDKFYCEIIRLYVGLDFQGKRIGTKLLEYIKIYCKNKEYEKIIIWTIKNLPNNVFYIKNGGIVNEERDLEIGGKKYPGIKFLIDLE